jgi:uncharacterized protein YqgV (UPF0045/DUF77 family)
MIGISAQVSLYPLGGGDMAGAIAAFAAVLDAHALPYRMGDMSTVLWGDAKDVFDALGQAFERVAESQSAVMVITVSNACPASGAAARPDISAQGG